MQIPKIIIFKRKDTLPSDKDIYQVDIIGDDFNHHGVGETPVEALLNATRHWYRNVTTPLV